jgi:hypothetical protein
MTYRHPEPVDAAISSFLLEHLETPSALLENIAQNMKPNGFAFVTGALTAAEIDHITEFRRESELITLAEDAGFRVIATLSSGPPRFSPKLRFMPRSMALLLQKRINDIW